MNVSETFIRKPIATSLLMAAIALFGVVAYRALPVADLPNVDFPTLTVSANLPGANPETMASAVATPLERQFTGIAGVDSMTSVNSLGSSQITLQFDLSRDLDGASVDVETAIAEALPLLPPGMPNPPSFRKVNPAESPIMFLGLTSDTLPIWVVDEYAQTRVAQRVSTVNGVAQVQVFGAQKYAVHVQLDPNKLAAKQIGINEVEQAIQNWNVNTPTGTLFGPHRAYNIQASGQLSNAAEYRSVVVTYRNGTPVRLEQLGRVLDGVEDDRTGSWLYNKQYGGINGVNLVIMRQPGSNVIEVTDAVKRLLPSFQAQLPPAISMMVRGDRSKNIRDAFHDTQVTLVITLGLVILVIFFFLRNASATLIPSLALPFSIIGTFAVMYLLDYSLDNLSMMALLLCVGFVVDDAIVMLENTVRHVEKGERPLEAALRGSREISFTIVSMTLSLTAVFIPVLFLGGILGRLFREFAVTISVAILISGVVSVTLTPMLCSRFLRVTPREEHGRLYRITEAFFNALLHLYEVTLRWVLRHRPVMAVVFVAVVGATIQLYRVVPKGFIPEVDNDQLSVNIDAAQGTSFYRMKDLNKIVCDTLNADPNVESFMSSVGGNFSPSGSNSGRMMVALKPRQERELSAFQIADRLRPRVSGFPGVRVFIQVPSAIRLGGRMSKSQYEITIQGPDTPTLYSEGQKFEREMAKLPMVQDVVSDLQMRNPRINLKIDRDRAASLQLDSRQIQNVLYGAYGPRWVSTIYSANSQNRVLMELMPDFQKHADSLSLLYLKSGAGQLVPLSAVAKVGYDAGPQTINHSGQLPSVTVSFNLKTGVALGEAVDQIGELAREILPANLHTSFQGSAKAFQDSLVNLGVLLTVAILIVYIVLGVLYESYVHPLTILSGLPAAGLGALLTLLIFHEDLTIYAFVGLMMLIGIVKKNAIMQIDFALEQERKEGKSPAEAILQGCLTRFRPIMMTSAAAAMGALPIALGFGSGGEARRGLGLAVVGGLVFSQMITLYLTPVVYTYMAALVTRWHRWKVAAPALPAGELTGARP